MSSLVEPGKAAAAGLVLYAGSQLFSSLATFHRLRTNLRDKVICITGASSGIGREMALLSFAFGAKVILLSRRQAVLEDLQKELLRDNPSRLSRHIKVISADLANLDSIPEIATEIWACFNSLDVLINNAGIAFSGSVRDTKLEIHKEVMDINYFSQVALTRELLPYLISQSQPSTIVAMSSLQGKVSLPARSAYGASKHAVQAFYDCLRSELAADESSHHMTVCVVSPGYVNTDIAAKALTSSGQAYGKLESQMGRVDKTECARRVLEGVVNSEQDVIIAPWYHRAAPLLRNAAPGIFSRVMAHKAQTALAKL